MSKSQRQKPKPMVGNAPLQHVQHHDQHTSVTAVNLIKKLPLKNEIQSLTESKLLFIAAKHISMNDILTRLEMVTKQTKCKIVISSKSIKINQLNPLNDIIEIKDMTKICDYLKDVRPKSFVVLDNMNLSEELKVPDNVKSDHFIDIKDINQLTDHDVLTIVSLLNKW